MDTSWCILFWVDNTIVVIPCTPDTMTIDPERSFILPPEESVEYEDEIPPTHLGIGTIEQTDIGNNMISNVIHVMSTMTLGQDISQEHERTADYLEIPAEVAVWHFLENEQYDFSFLISQVVGGDSQ